MKKCLFLGVILIACLTFNLKAQDTIIGFNFSDNANTGFNPNFGLTENLIYNVSAENSAGDLRTLTYTTGLTDFAATADNWQDGADDKFWSVNFKADGYSSFKLYSKQRSGGSNPGPKNWKIQTRLETGTWEDVAGGTVVCGNDWTTGVVADLALPASLDEPGTSMVSIRWIMVDNVNVSGGVVASAGITKIEDIFVTGVLASGKEEVVFDSKTILYPNPCNGILNLMSSEEMTRIVICNTPGTTVYENSNVNSVVRLNVSDFSKGLYFVSIYGKNESSPVVNRLVIN